MKASRLQQPRERFVCVIAKDEQSLTPELGSNPLGTAHGMPAPAAPTQGISYQLRPIGGSSATGAGTDGGRRHRLARTPKMRDSAQAMVQHVGLPGSLRRPVRARASQAFRRARGHRATTKSASDRERTIAIPPENTSPPLTSSNASNNRPPTPLRGGADDGVGPSVGGGTARPRAAAASRRGRLDTPWRESNQAALAPHRQLMGWCKC